MGVQAQFWALMPWMEASSWVTRTRPLGLGGSGGRGLGRLGSRRAAVQTERSARNLSTNMVMKARLDPFPMANFGWGFGVFGCLRLEMSPFGFDPSGKKRKEEKATSTANFGWGFGVAVASKFDQIARNKKRRSGVEGDFLPMSWDLPSQFSPGGVREILEHSGEEAAIKKTNESHGV